MTIQPQCILYCRRPLYNYRPLEETGLGWGLDAAKVWALELFVRGTSPAVKQPSLYIWHMGLDLEIRVLFF